MQMNYRHGLTERMAGIAGEALGQVLAERNLCMEDLIIMMDGASDETLDRMERILSRSTLLLRLAANERDDAAVLGVQGHQPAVPGGGSHDPNDGGVVHLQQLRVRHVQLD